MAIVGNGSTGWTIPGLGHTSEAPITLFMWARAAASPATNNAVFVAETSTGNGNTHAAILATTTNQWWGHDLADDFTGGIPVLSGTFDGLWHPVVYTRANASSHTLYVSSVANTAVDTGTGNTQTLTDFWVGTVFAGSSQPMQTNSAVAEVAKWNVALGTTEVGQLMSGYCPLGISPSSLACYFPLKYDLADYTGSGRSLAGVQPVFTDHPPVQDYQEYMQDVSSGPDFYGPYVFNLSIRALQ